MSAPATDQEIEDWMNANRDYFDAPTWAGSGPPDTCVITTSLGAGSEPDCAFGLADYKTAKQIASNGGKALRGTRAEATRDPDTGEVGVRITGGWL